MAAGRWIGAVVTLAAFAVLVPERVQASADTEPPPTLTADGSAQPTSPEAGAFCDAQDRAVALTTQGDSAGAAQALAEVAVPAGVADAVTTLSSTEVASAEWNVAYEQMFEWMSANCGFAELDVTATEYAYSGIPPTLSFGPLIVNLHNEGVEAHEVVFVRIDDGSTSAEQLLAMPAAEAEEDSTVYGAAIAFPGETAHLLVSLTSGEYVVADFLPQHDDPDALAAATVGTTTPVGEFGPPHHTLGMYATFHV
jgi:hypothetical protein